jgi:hypothetical protein
MPPLRKNNKHPPFSEGVKYSIIHDIGASPSASSMVEEQTYQVLAKRGQVPSHINTAPAVTEPDTVQMEKRLRKLEGKLQFASFRSGLIAVFGLISGTVWLWGLARGILENRKDGQKERDIKLNGRRLRTRAVTVI